MNASNALSIDPTRKKRLTLVDGSGFIFRAFFAMPSLTKADGTPTGAVYGFINMMVKLLNDRLTDEVEDHLAVIFDAGRHTFRNELYSEYKANRDEPPAELKPQFALVREATEALCLPAIEFAGYEADDLIASYTKAARADGYEVVIVSSDKDLMQLVDDEYHICMFDAMKDKVIDNAAVLDKFGVEPAKVLDVLSLMGDSSDNVPGVPGIGPKTAAQLIQEFGDLENLLNNAGRIKQNKRRETLIENADNARLSHQLITLKDDVDLPMSLDELIVQPPDNEKLLAFVREMGFKSIAKRLEKESIGFGHSGESQNGMSGATAPTENITKPQSIEYSLIQDEKTLQQWINRAHEVGFVAITLEYEKQSLIGLSFCSEVGKAAYLPLGHITSNSQDDLFAAGPTLAKGQIPQDKALSLLQPLLTARSVLKIGYRSKADIRLLLALEQNMSPIDDVCLINYCLYAGLQSSAFEEVVSRELDHSLTPIEEITGKGRNKIQFAEAEFDNVQHYAAEKADYCLRLWHHLKQQLFEHKLYTPYETLERPLIPILAQMEHAGILVDRERLKRLSTEFSENIEQIAAQIYKAAGMEFAIGSPKQLGEVLFEHLGIEGGKRSAKSGQYSTGAEVLEELAAQGHPIASDVLEWRQYEKLRSTYTDALEKQIHKKTGRVHTTFQQTIAATGRLSSTEPNLQNIPIRTEQGKRIRKAFIAADGHSLLSADYSQIELRLLAEMANIEVLKQAFKDKLDIHAATASQMFNVPLDEMTSDLRRKAKTINFGIIYGISAHGLAVRLGIERSEAARFIDAYFEHYPGIRRYMEAKKQEATENGYITTLYGRRVHIAGIQEKNYQRRAFAERQAINAPLQGTAADIIKRAMIQLQPEIADKTDKIRLLLQVHDELVFEIKKGCEELYAPKIKQVMEQAAHLSVPLVVETGIGHDWGEIH